MNHLQRVQVYLEPNSVSLIDQIAKEIRINRSQVIRDATASVANRYIKTVQFLKSSKKTKPELWLKLAGIEESKTGVVGLNVDEIYLND